MKAFFENFSPENRVDPYTRIPYLNNPRRSSPAKTDQHPARVRILERIVDQSSQQIQKQPTVGKNQKLFPRKEEFEAQALCHRQWREMIAPPLVTDG